MKRIDRKAKVEFFFCIFPANKSFKNRKKNNKRNSEEDNRQNNSENLVYGAAEFLKSVFVFTKIRFFSKCDFFFVISLTFSQKLLLIGNRSFYDMFLLSLSIYQNEILLSFFTFSVS